MASNTLDEIDLIAVGTNEDEPGVWAVLRCEATEEQALEAVSRSEGIAREKLTIRPAKWRWTWGDPYEHRGRLRLVWHIEEAPK